MPLILKKVETARGPRWIGEAFRLYARRPLSFTGMSLAFYVAAMLVRELPPVGALLPLMALPLLSLGFMVASQSALLDGPVRPLQFIEPLRGDKLKRRALLILCGMYGAAVVLIMGLADAISGHAWTRLQALLAKGETAQPQIEALLSEPSLGLALLFGGTLGTLLSVAYWHAPALVHWGGQGVKQALFSSTLAVWRSKGAITMFTLAWLGLMLLFGMLASIAMQLLGLQAWAGVLSLPSALVFSAVFYISVLFTFNDSFGGAGPATAPVPPAPA